MKEYEKEISKDVYDRAMKDGGAITKEDRKNVFSFDQLYGYGVYTTRVEEKDGKYIVRYTVGDSCD